MNETNMTFHTLYKQYAKDVYRFAYWLTGNEDEAKDITSETFFRAWTAKTEPHTETVKAYLFTITRNLFLKNRYRKNRFSEINEEFTDRTIKPDEQAEINSYLVQVMKALQQLPEIDKSILIMRAEDEMSYRDIARTTGLSVAAVKVKVFRARIKINKILNEGE
jgi:RNA polymerase sigma-70 factor (ECF subfamily)